MLTVLDGNCFFVADHRGDATRHHEGLYWRDTRYLSTWRLLVNGQPPELLTASNVNYYSAAIYLRNAERHSLPAGALSIRRDLIVSSGSFQTAVVVQNHLIDPVEVEIELVFDCDFRDLFEVKADEYRSEDLVFAARPAPELEVSRGHDAAENSWTFRAVDGPFQAETLMWMSRRGEVGGDRVRFSIELEPGCEWENTTNLVLLADDDRRRDRYNDAYFGDERSRVERSLAAWRSHVPEIVTPWNTLERTFRRSVADLAALRMSPPRGIQVATDLPAAGLPWFMTVFGRDTLITSYETMMLGPDLATGALDALAALQADSWDDARDAEPGKIVHEVRVGRVALKDNFFPYYGTVDATVLFLIVLSEAYRWGGDRSLVERLRPAAMRALEWMRTHADLNGDGLIEYHRRSSRGLETQSWRDSWDSMRFHDGTIATSPIAPAEVQGYAFDARMRMAELAEEVWQDDVLAAQLRREAAELRQRFEERFTVHRDGVRFYALGLDHEGRQIDCLSSAVGHLLWSGIVPDERARECADQLISPALFSGWGVRTLSSNDRGFNPIGYHTGTVWPHDTAIAVGGLMRYGFRAEAVRIGTAMLEAAEYFDHRMPEVFAGYGRDTTPVPVSYPTACSPQAWAAGAPLLIVTALLDLRADRHSGVLVSERPAPLPQPVELRGISAIGSRFDVVADGDSVAVSPSG